MLSLLPWTIRLRLTLPIFKKKPPSEGLVPNHVVRFKTAFDFALTGELLNRPICQAGYKLLQFHEAWQALFCRGTLDQPWINQDHFARRSISFNSRGLIRGRCLKPSGWRIMRNLDLIIPLSDVRKVLSLIILVRPDRLLQVGGQSSF